MASFKKKRKQKENRRGVTPLLQSYKFEIIDDGNYKGSEGQFKGQEGCFEKLAQMENDKRFTRQQRGRYLGISIESQTLKWWTTSEYFHIHQ